MTNRDAQLAVEDINAWEEKYGQIPETGVIVVMNSGSSNQYSTPRKYFGYPDGVKIEKNTKDLHFPGVHPDATKFLVHNRCSFFGIFTMKFFFGKQHSLKTTKDRV